LILGSSKILALVFSDPIRCDESDHPLTNRLLDTVGVGVARSPRAPLELPLVGMIDGPR